MQRRSGFSMVELSIVLIIIGLLVAAVTAGTKIIKQAKLRQVLAEISTLRNATQTFEATYDALPGDFNLTESYFTANSCNAGSCAGDGDGNVEISGNEDNYALKHLALGKLLTYDIVEGDSYVVDGFYSFTSKYSENSCYNGLGNSKDTSGNDQYGAENSSIDGVVSVLAQANTTDDDCIDAILTVPDADFIDTKLDDGSPHDGTVRIWVAAATVGSKDPNVDSGSLLCSTTEGTQASGDTYDVVQTGQNCNLVFKVR